MQKKYHIGIVGYGFLGKSLHQSLADTDISVSAVFNRSAEKLAALSPEVATTDIDQFLQKLDSLDLVIELAQADFSRKYGQQILAKTHYMPCSVSALADDDLKATLLATAKDSHKKIFIPHGAAVGMDNLTEARDKWSEVTITFRKPAANIDGAADQKEDEKVLFDGSVREISEKFPRSVNSMVACALATAGLDKSRARMIADNRLKEVLSGEFEFVGHDNSKLTITKQEPAVGVSSTGMINSLKGSVKRALGCSTDTLSFV